MKVFDEQQRYWIWLNSVNGIGPVTFYALIAQFEDAKNVWDAVKTNNPLLNHLPHSKKNALLKYGSEDYIDDVFEKCERKGIVPVTMLDDNYPDNLKEIVSAPPTIYIKGNIDDLAGKVIAIVGTRNCSSRGFEYVKEIAYDLAKSGVHIVSGMARGIDSAAAMGALKAGMPTYAVMGCGADVIYPPENAKIYQEICDNGAIISEYLPGVPPLSGNFPSRNRIISGLSKGVLIVESSFKSGASITMNYAAEQSRDVMAVPGVPYDSKSQLPNSIIRDGGLLVTCANDILNEYKWAKSAKNREKSKKINLELDFFQEQLYNLLLQGEMSIEEIEQKADIDQVTILSSLMVLELKGIINKNPGNIYSLKYII